MRKLTYHLLLFLTLCTALACKQSSREEAQEQFRQRQQAVLERDAEQQTSNSPEAGPSAATPETAAAEGNPSKPATTAGDKVVGIKDGDTVELLRNGKTETVRLFGVDAPEKAQAYGQRARQFTSDLAFGKNVRLIVNNTDRYGRTVGTIILPDGRSLNEELVRNGYAWHYKAYSNDLKLANLETDARRYKRGLWQDANPVAPWDYRKEKRSGGTAKETPAPLPAGAAKRTVYICNSTSSGVYHLTRDCHVLKRCKQEILAITEEAAIQVYDRRLDKACSQP
ncbi:thermonuclease family protein [Pontibacter russatus]|uniref:thermonuclease family protein n=1 Tax=Pontibacter russatus TaxID=2694929 RepID=UPI00137B6670|nr:thermonuclease family protein [Pontibacter russatus]